MYMFQDILYYFWIEIGELTSRGSPESQKMYVIIVFRWQCYRAGEVILDTEDPKTADRVRTQPVSQDFSLFPKCRVFQSQLSSVSIIRLWNFSQQVRKTATFTFLVVECRHHRCTSLSRVLESWLPIVSLRSLSPLCCTAATYLTWQFVMPLASTSDLRGLPSCEPHLPNCLNSAWICIVAELIIKFRACLLGLHLNQCKSHACDVDILCWAPC